MGKAIDRVIKAFVESIGPGKPKIKFAYVYQSTYKQLLHETSWLQRYLKHDSRGQMFPILMVAGVEVRVVEPDWFKRHKFNEILWVL